LAGNPSADEVGAKGVAAAPLVPPDGTDAVTGSASLQAAATLTLLVGLLLTLMGSGHLYGVVVTAGNKGYAYDFRLAALLLLGITMVFGAMLCLTAVLGLARGKRGAWDRAVIGTILLLMDFVLMIPLQPDMAPGLSILAGVNLAALLAGRGRLGSLDAR
jgi:hypothetical protein